MNILWISNIIFPEEGTALSIPYSNGGGWMIEFMKQLGNDKKHSLTVCSFSTEVQEIKKIKINDICYVVFPKKNIPFHKYDKFLETTLKIYFDSHPVDLVHIWGTEFSHSLIATMLSNELNIKNIISIQGLISACSNSYFCDLSSKDVSTFTIRDILKRDTTSKQKTNFRLRGEYEIQSLNLTKNVIGRTDWDYANTRAINPNLSYYFCNECLRNQFYTNKWDIKKIQRHSIFVSQANYPIKGFHLLLDAMVILRNIYPNLKVYVAGCDSPLNKSFLKKERNTGYMKVVAKKILEHKLEDCCVFLGYLGEAEMIQAYLDSNVFVSASSIENSPNSVGEAMLLGVPIVSSFVGGVGSMIEHDKEGLLYPYQERAMLANYISKIFNDDELALRLSENSIKRAKIIFDRDVNTKTLKEIYTKIVEG